MTDRRRSAVAVALAVASYASWLTALVVAHRLEVVVQGNLEDFLDTALFDLSAIGFPAVGALLVVRRPANRVGWAVLLFGVAMYWAEPFTGGAQLVLVRGGELTGALAIVASVASAAAVLPIAVFAHVLLYFPNGSLTRLAALLSRSVVVVTGLLVVVRLLRPSRLDGVPVMNPLGVAGLPAGDEVVGPLTAALFALGLVALGRLVVRYRAADAVERKQFQWLLASVVALPVLWTLGNAVEEVNYAVGQWTAIAAIDLGLLGFVIALHRAVTRHDLFGIDRLVSRTLTYALLSGVLVATYLGLVLALGSAARAITGESGDGVVALSTLAVAAIAQPVRRRLHDLVDRRFNRGSYDAARTIDAFGRGLRDEVSLDAVAGDLRTVAVRTFRPASVGVVLVGTEP